MKKLALIAILVFSISAVYAQKGKVTAANGYLETNDLDAAKKAIDAALEHEKSVNWPKTYIVAAKVYTQLSKDGKDPEGINKSVDFYKKAIDLDQKGDAKGKGIGKYEKEIKLQLTFFKPDLTNEGIEGFNTEDFNKALFAFENVLYFDSLPMFEEESAGVDTSVIYNCALAAYNSKDWEKAEKYFQESLDYGYGGGDVVLLLDQVYDASGDSAKIPENLKKGFAIYPEDDRILTTLIQYYLDAQENEAALEYLNTAVEKDPNNASFYYARGVLYENDDKDKAIENYKSCLEIDENFFNSLYNIGVIYFNKGVEQQTLANDKTTTKGFNEAMKVANEYWEQALPYMEKALEVQPEETAVLETLKNLYYRFDKMDKYNEVKAKLDALK